MKISDLLWDICNKYRYSQIGEDTKLAIERDITSKIRELTRAVDIEVRISFNTGIANIDSLKIGDLELVGGCSNE